MKVIRPTELADSMLVNTSAVNADADYSAATTYALNARCTYNRRIYQSLQAANTGHTPNTSPTWWVDAGPCNKWAMFDQQISTATIATNTLTVTLATGIIDSLAVINAVAASGQLVVRDGPGGDILFDKIIGLSGDVPTDWYQYFFFDPLTPSTQAIFQNLPPYASAHATLTLTGGGDVSVGAVVFGLSSHIGDAQYGASAGIVDYSRKDTDAFGVTTFFKRAFSKRMTVSLVLDSSQLNRVQRLLYGLRATPCVWIGADDARYDEAMTVYGFYKDFSATIAYSQHSLYSLEIEGLS